MTYFQIIKKILEKKKKGISVPELLEKVREEISTCPVERIYMTLSKMQKKDLILKKREGMYNYYVWKGKTTNRSNKYSRSKKNYD